MKINSCTRSHDSLIDMSVAAPSPNWRPASPPGNGAAGTRPKMALAAGDPHVCGCDKPGAESLANLTDLGTTNPIAGAYDIAQFSTNGNMTFPDGLNYYPDSQIAPESASRVRCSPPEPARRATDLCHSPSRPRGIGDEIGIGTPQIYDLHIYSMSLVNVTLIQATHFGPGSFS